MNELTESGEKRCIERPDTPHFRLLVLGAGFSKAAGLPLASDLWQEVLTRARRLQGRAGRLDSDLERYVEYRGACDGKELKLEQVNFEDFMEFLDIEHFLWLRGRDTWSSEGNESTVLVKSLIGQILVERTPAVAAMPALYRDFASRLSPGDWILTFNYDTLLERALEAAGIPYRLVPDSPTDERGLLTSDNDVVVLKLHGSVDWFGRSERTKLERRNKEMGYGTGSGFPSPIWGHESELDVQPLCPSHFRGASELEQIRRVGHIEDVYSRGISFDTPLILPPSSAKILYSGRLRSFWYDLGRTGGHNGGLAIVGYSMPEQDEYARQVLYSLAINYQQTPPQERPCGLSPSPVAVINYAESEEEVEHISRRYGFVDWEHAILHTKGFNEEAIEAIFT